MSIMLVSLISDQAIPNVLFIKNRPIVDGHLFISTEKMQKRGIVENIIKACSDIVKYPETLVVEEDNLEDIYSKLENFVKNLDCHFIVNITGGTKIMSLGVFEFFSKSQNNQLFYLPLGKNTILKIFPEDSNEDTLLEYRIDLHDYLISNGVIPEAKSFTSKNQLLKTEKETSDLYSKFSSESNHLLKLAAEHFRVYRQNEKIKEIDLVNEEKWYLQPFLDAGFSTSSKNKLSRAEIKYCTGDWFEEYVYSLIKSTKQKSEHEIGFGVHLTRDNVKNEFDVIFTQNNALYVIECKTDVANEEGKFAELFNNTLYKAGSLRKDFGLFVKFYLFAVNDFSMLSKQKLDRARVLDINLVGTEVLNNEDKLIQFISKM